MLKGDIIKGYQITQDFSTAGGGLSKWSFAQKGGEEYFIKEFLSPKFPTKNAPGSAKNKSRKLKLCKKFEAHHKALIREINAKCGKGGNLVYTVDFFRNESKYYKVTEKVSVASLSPQEISQISLAKRILILKTISHSLSILHKVEVVHGDLKPDNILIKQTKTGNFTSKLIDFDNSFFSGQAPEMAEDLVGDMVYYSPELLAYLQDASPEKGRSLTEKSDIFALGLLFCQYLGGQLPAFDHHSFNYAAEACLAGAPILVHPLDLPADLVELLESMLQLNYKARPSIFEIFESLKGFNVKEENIEKTKVSLKVFSKSTTKKESSLKGKGLNIIRPKK